MFLGECIWGGPIPFSFVEFRNVEVFPKLSFPRKWNISLLPATGMSANIKGQQKDSLWDCTRRITLKSKLSLLMSLYWLIVIKHFLSEVLQKNPKYLCGSRSVLMDTLCYQKGIHTAAPPVCRSPQIFLASGLCLLTHVMRSFQVYHHPLKATWCQTSFFT